MARNTLLDSVVPSFQHTQGLRMDGRRPGCTMAFVLSQGLVFQICKIRGLDSINSEVLFTWKNLGFKDEW